MKIIVITLQCISIIWTICVFTSTHESQIIRTTYYYNSTNCPFPFVLLSWVIIKHPFSLVGSKVFKQYFQSTIWQFGWLLLGMYINMSSIVLSFMIFWYKTHSNDMIICRNVETPECFYLFNSCPTHNINLIPVIDR